MKTPKKILDRRRAVRIAEVLPFKIGHEGYDIEAQTINVSAHGVMCILDKEISLMTQVNIALNLPGAKGHSKLIHAKGVVVRKEKDPRHGKKFLVAVYFAEIKESDQKALDEYISACLKK